MISRIDHVAIAVKDYDGALRFFSKRLGAVPGMGMGMEDPSIKGGQANGVCKKGIVAHCLFEIGKCI